MWSLWFLSASMLQVFSFMVRPLAKMLGRLWIPQNSLSILLSFLSVLLLYIPVPLSKPACREGSVNRQVRADAL